MAGNLFKEKKVCAFEWCLMLIKNILSLLAGKNLALSDWFSPTKSSVYFLFYARLCSNPQKFFPLGNPPYAKKSKRDSLYFDLLPGPFKSAIIFFIICTIMEDNKMKIQLLFLSFFIIIWYNSLLISVYSSW